MSDSDGPVLLVVFDGWGYRPDSSHNAVAAANTPNFDQLWDAYPHLALAAAGESVGLSPGTVGNGPAGFATLAAGRAVTQAERLLHDSVRAGRLGDEPPLRELLAGLGDGGRLHLLGLVSGGQVVSSEPTYFALLRWLQAAGVPGERVFIHALLDGHDTPPRSGMNWLARFAGEMMRTGIGRVATIIGRHYAMPAEPQAETVERAYGAIVHGAGRLAPTAIQAIQAGYSRGEDDADLSPAVVLGNDGLPLGRVRPEDAVLAFCHHPRGLEPLLSALAAPEHAAFDRGEWPAPRVLSLAGSDELAARGVAAVFRGESPAPTLLGSVTGAGRRVAVLGESAAADHLAPLLVGAAPEKVALQVLPSPPRGVPEPPERLCDELTAAACAALDARAADLVVVDYTFADRAGHRGHLEGARAAVEALDATLPKLVRAARRAGASMLLTACHGNVEQLELPNAARPGPAHTANRVPLVLIDDRFKGCGVPADGQATLADVAPTVTALLGVEPEADWTGCNLVALLTPLDRPPEAAEAQPAAVEIDAVEALAMAILVAEQARDYYLAAAQAAGDPESGVLYRHLAAGEAERLESWRRRLVLLRPEPGATSFPAAAPVSAPEPSLTPLEVLEAAIREELETYRLLCELAARNLNPQGTVVMEQLANDELALLDRLQRLTESEAIRLLSALPALVGGATARPASR